MDAQQALADLAEISSQIQAAVVFDEKGTIAASTAGNEAAARPLAEGAARLLDEAQRLAEAAPLKQLEVATSEGSVFVVADGPTRIAATTAPEPTVGLVFYDLKSALRSIADKPTPKKRAAAAKKPAPAAAKKPAPAAAKKPAPDAEKKPAADAAKKPPAEKPTPKPRAAKPAPRKKPDAP